MPKMMLDSDMFEKYILIFFCVLNSTINVRICMLLFKCQHFSWTPIKLPIFYLNAKYICIISIETYRQIFAITIEDQPRSYCRRNNHDAYPYAMWSHVEIFIDFFLIDSMFNYVKKGPCNTYGLWFVKATRKCIPYI